MSGNVIFYIILSGIIALLVALFQYRYKVKSRTSVHTFLLILRFVTVFAILLLVFNPKIEQLKIVYEKPNLVVAVDNSNSMVFLKQDSIINQLLNSIKNNTKLNDRFNIDYYSFGSDLKTLDSMPFQDKQTNFDKLFSGLNDIYKQITAPTLVLSDGNQTYGSDYRYAFKTYNQPVFPVILGDTTTHTDLKIEQLNVNKYAFLKNKFPIEVILSYNGKSEVNSELKVAQNGNVVYRSPIALSEEKNTLVHNFTLPANQTGVFEYQLAVDELPSEKNTNNNSKNFAIEVIDEKSNIAIITDWLHPDIGALKKSIETNEQRSVSILSPLDFLKKHNDFQLSILYQPNNRFNKVYELLETSKRNKLVITGTKTDWNFLNQVNPFYSQRNASQTEDYLPEPNKSYSAFILSTLDFESFPPLKTKFGNVEFSVPYETLLYKKVRNTVTDNPLMASFETNGRREAVIFGENIWQWRAQSFLNTKSFNNFDDFIGKLIQYLATNKRKERLTVDYNAFYEGSNHVIIKAQFFNKNYEFDNRERLSIEVTDTKSKSVKTYPFILNNNNFQVDLSNLPASSYDFIVKTETENLSKSGSFKILEYNIEQQFLNANVDKMEALASNNYGQAYFANTTAELFESLLTDNRFATIEKSTKNTVPLIDWKYLLALIVISLTLEWFIRKYNGLI